MAEDIVAQLPDGTELRFPANTPDSVVDKVVKSHLAPSEPYKMSEEDKTRVSDIVSGGKPSVASAKFGEKTFAEKYPLTTGYGVGLAKPIAGISQFAGINAPEQFLQEKEKEARLSGRAGIGATKFGGELTSLLTGASLIPKVNLLPSNVQKIIEASPFLKGAIAGGATSAVLPTETKEDQSYTDFLKSKAEDVLESSLLGGGVGKATQLAFSPKVGERVKKLIESGQKDFTPAQLLSDTPILGTALKRAEESASSLPIAGTFIRGSLKKSVENFNKNIANKVLQPLGESLDKSMKAGHEMIDYVHNKVSSAYDDIAPKLQFSGVFKTDGQSTIKNLTDKLKNVTDDLTPEDTTKVTGAFNKFIIDPLQENLVLSGEKFRAAESKLGKAAYDAYKKGDYNISNAYRDLQDELRGLLAQQNPKYASRLSNIHESFKRYLRLEKAGSYRGAEEGVFSPAQFRSAVESIGGKRQTARGKALMQEEAKIAEDVLGKKVPDSGTAERLFTGLLPKYIVEGASHVGTAGIPLAITGAIYNPITQRLLTNIATKRPEFMRRVAPALQSLTSKGAVLSQEDEQPIGGLNQTNP